MCTVSPSTNHKAWQPRECGPEASKDEIERGLSGTRMSNSSKPAGLRPKRASWSATAIKSPETSSELERIWACGRSVCTMTFGARGSLTSTAVKFLGALSCASHSTRRPSRERCSAMPSPMPPIPLRPCWASSVMLRDMEPKISSRRHGTGVGVETLFVEPAPRLAVSVEGSGPLVLFLHGIRGNRRNWNLQLPVFAQHFRAAAWDARGYGDSDDYEGPLHFDHLTGDVLRVAEHLKADKLHLVGLSMGGRIARNVALHYPERLHSLTLINSTPGFDSLSTDQVRKFVVERKTHTADAVRQLLGSRARPGAYEELTESISRLHEKSYLKTVEASVAQDRAAPIEAIRVPTLIIGGDEDTVYPPELAQEMARRIPGAQLVMMEGAGHLVNLEQPERFDAAVLPFLLRNQKERSEERRVGKECRSRWAASHDKKNTR